MVVGPEALDWIRLHMALECTGINAEGDLYRLDCPNPDTLFRVYAARHDQGDSLFFRSDLPPAVRQKLKRLPIHCYFEEPERVKTVLAEDGPCEDLHIGKSYLFLSTLSIKDYPDVIRLSLVDPELVLRYDVGMNLIGREVFGVVVDGQIVSTCESSREDDRAAESWVRTLPGYRRRGYARQVTAAWARDLQQRGKVPFFSHKWGNLASQAVAQSLGLIQYLADARYA